MARISEDRGEREDSYPEATDEVHDSARDVRLAAQVVVLAIEKGGLRDSTPLAPRLGVDCHRRSGSTLHQVIQSRRFGEMAEEGEDGEKARSRARAKK